MLQNALLEDYAYCKNTKTDDHQQIAKGLDIMYSTQRMEGNKMDKYEEDIAFMSTILADKGNKMRELMPNCWDYLVSYFLPAIATDQDKELVRELQNDASKKIDLDLRDPEDNKSMVYILQARAIKIVNNVQDIQNLIGIPK
jgi:hypothetical protein